ncbi:MAG: histidine kinase [Candidatus Dormibacteria bacterium]
MAQNPTFRQPPLRLIQAVVVVDALGLPIGLYRHVASPASGGYGGSASDTILLAAAVVQLALAALVCLRRRGHPVGLLLLAAVTAGIVDDEMLQPVIHYGISHRGTFPYGDLIGTVDQMSWIPFVVPMAILLPLVFPTGTLLSRRWRWAVRGTVVASVLGVFGGAFATKQDQNNLVAGVHPVHLPGMIGKVADIAELAIFALPLFVLLGVLALVLRYRRGSSEVRHQLKWLIAAVTTYLVGFGASVIPEMLGKPITWLQDLAVLGLALIPVAAAIAVLKYRLYDIDVVLSRALVYGSLAAFISAVYVAIVVGVGALVGSGGRPNLVLSVLATAVVAVAFQPVREFLQRFANRIVYGKRSTPYEVLSAFSSRVAESYAGEEVLNRMAQVLGEATGAERADVWLRSGGAVRRVASWPPPAGGVEPGDAIEVSGQLMPEMPGAGRAVPVRHDGELLGILAVTRRAGETLTPIEEKLVEDLAQQAGLVLRNVALTADLQARLEDLRSSRQRLVAAQDQERQRLERNLHDGAQQNLVAFKVKLGLAEMAAGKDLERASLLVGELKKDADEALETLRDLARGIYPPLLADQGLVAALSAQARKAVLPVEVTASGIDRYPQDIEAAVYFSCLEALQNIQKYARAGSATIALTGSGESLHFEVADDGVGFDPAVVARGSGLQNIEDRLDAIGGTLTLQSRPGGGTRLGGRLPLALATVAG